MKRVVICAAQRDRKYVERLEEQLHVLVKNGTIAVWHLGKMLAGIETAKAIRDNLAAADIIVLLISADLISGMDSLVQQALAQKERGAQFVPVVVRATFLADERLLQMNRLPADGRPLSPRADEETAWVEATQAIVDLAGSLSSSAPGPDQRVPPAASSTAPGQALKLLFLGVAPTGAEPMKLDREVKAIGRRIDYAQRRSRIELIQEWAVTAEELSQILLRHEPSILHISSHGTPDGRLVLLDGQERGKPVPRAVISKLFGMFRKKGLRCVVLNACYAEEQAREVAQHIEFVIGVSGAILDECSLAFSAGFYSGLAAGQTVEDAFSFGCIQIAMQGQTQDDAPKLFWRQDADPKATRLL